MGDAGGFAGLQTGETGETGGQPGAGAGGNRGNRAPRGHVGRESDDFRGEDGVRRGGEETAVGGGKSAARRRADAARPGVSAAGVRGSEWVFGGDLRGRIVDLREGGVRAAGGKRVRIGRGEDQCAANEGRVQLDVVGDEDFAERVVRCADVILKGAGAVDLVFIVFGSVLVVSLFVCLFVEEAKFTQFILLVDECGSGH